MARRRPKPSSLEDTVRVERDDPAPARTDPPAARKRIGPYEVGRILGAGGMGVVYAAQSPELGPVAIKILNTRDPEFAKRFAREARIRIESKHVVRVLGAGTDEGGLPYILFELLEGRSLTEIVDAGPVAPARAVDIGLQTLAGLAVVHSAGIIHRDIKPANLFDTRDGTVKLLDFGIAMVADTSTKITQSGGVVGTPSYLSPEQACGDPDIDETTDLWSLGAVLYELLSGKPPFWRSTAIATLLAIVREPLVSLREVAPDVPVDLAAVIERALEKPRSRRWRSAREFIAALKEVDPTTRGASRIVSAEALAADERRVVAVLLAEGVHQIEVLRAVIEVRGGAFVPLVGSRALGLFGGEKWEGDEVKRAVNAALDARAVVDSVAVASGRAARLGGAIFGEALSLAEEGCGHRLEGIAIDSASARAFDGIHPLRAVDAKIVELLPGKDPSAMRFRVTPLLGRELELAQMEAALERTIEGGREALLAIGPPGIGKSRLLLEMERLVAERGHRPLVGRGEPVKRDVSFALLASMLGSTVDPDLSPRAKRNVILQMVRGAIDPDAEVDRTAAFISELLGAEVDTTVELDAARQDQRLMADRLRLALLDLLAGMARERPLVLIADDLQWADDHSLDLLESLFDELDGSLFVFGTARSEFIERRPAFLRSRVQIEPRGLLPMDVAKLARALTGRAPSHELVESISERTEGNPLFVEQILLALEEQQVAPAGELPLPLTVEAAIQSRLDHLPSREKNLLKRASIFGRPFTLEEIDHLIGEDAKPLLAQLMQRGLLAFRSRGERVRRHRFSSSLVQDVAYRMLGDDLKRDLHRSAATHLSSDDGSDPEDVGRHWELGGEAHRAAECFAVATTTAARRGDNQSVLRCAQRATALGAPTERLYAVYLARSEALFFLGRKDEQRQALEAALRFAVQESERAAVRAELAYLLATSGQPEQALVLLDAAVREAEQSGDPDVRVRALSRRVVALLYAGRLELAEEALDLAERIDVSPAVRAVLAGCRGQLASAKGDPGARTAAFAEAVSRYEAVGDVRRAAGAKTNLADAWNRVGAYAEAEDALRRALIDCRRVGHRLMEGYALLNLGYACTLQKKTVQASAALDDCALIAKETADRRLQLWCRIYHSRAQLGSASPHSIAESLRAVAREASDSDLPSVEVAALWVAARAHLAAGDVASALEMSQRALIRRDDIGGVEEDEAEVFVTHALVLDAAGRPLDARAIRQLGRERVEAIARRILDDPLRKRFLREVPAHAALGVDVDVTAL